MRAATSSVARPVRHRCQAAAYGGRPQSCQQAATGGRARTRCMWHNCPWA